MGVLQGCTEGKSTPRLTEVKCPKCGEVMEVFVRMDGDGGVTGTTSSDEKCPKCGYVIPAGTPEDTLEEA